MTLVTVVIVTVGKKVIVTKFSFKKLDKLTTDEMFDGQCFAILAMFFTLLGTYQVY